MSYWSRVGPESNRSDVLIRCEDTRVENTMDDGGTYQPRNAKDYQWQPEVRKAV